MRKKHFFAGIAVLLLGTSTAFGQLFFNPAACDPCEPVACDPCEPIACDPCEPVCGPGGLFTLPFTFSGWVEMGVYTNSHGFKNNGPMHTESRSRTDVNMSQLYFSFEKEMNTRRGFDWGARTDLVYGSHAGSMQTYDGTFDAGWGANRHGYEMSAYLLYGELGYKDLSVRVGKFGTPVGWEGSASLDNFFYSHSYCYWIEPATHMGVLGTYDLTDRLSLNAGWTTGMDSSFANPNGNKAILAGFTYSLTDDATVYYWINGGEQRDKATSPIWTDYFVQSLCFEWNVTKRFTYVMQYNLRNDNERRGARTSAYGVNNHFLYKLTDKWGVGTRVEWLQDNADYIYAPGDYYQVTFGLNWNPYKNVSVRPEVRYDWCEGATPFRSGVNSYQVSGGCGVVVSF